MPTRDVISSMLISGKENLLDTMNAIGTGCAFRSYKDQ